MKPSIGLILIRAEWFDAVVALPQLVESVRADAQDIQSQLRQHFDLAGIWVVNSSESLQNACQGIRAVEVDLFILVFQVWAEDLYLLPLIRAIGDRPLAVWCFLPWQRLPEKISFIDVLRGSGPVGTFEGMGTLHNLGTSYLFTQGTPQDPRVVKDLSVAARAARVRRGLQSARFGLLPSRNEQMQSTFVDEFRLLAELGPSVQVLSIGQLQRWAEQLSEADVSDYLTELKKDYPIHGVSDSTLAEAARTSLGMAHLAIDHKLDVLSYNDISAELHETLGMRPCLYPPLYERAGIQVGLEGDLGAATALFVLQRLTGSPILFSEFWFWDEAENVIIGGHAGPQNPAIAKPGQAWISHDYEFAQSDRTEGAHLQFVARPGRVTLMQLRGTPQGWQAIVANGEAIDTPPRLEGYPHAVIHLDASIDRFVRQVAEVGSTQHWIMAYGDVVKEVQAFCTLQGIPLLTIV